MKRFHLLAAGVLAVLMLASTVAAQDMVDVAGKQGKVVLENERVRVIEIQIDPGATTGMHSHGDHLVVFLSGGMATQTMADGSRKGLDRKPGEVTWSGPVTHDTQNSGKQKVRSLVIELKDPPAQ